MWRSINKITENQDSDQSLSEEEDLDENVPGDCISLGGPTEQKGRVQVLSQFEILRDAHELEHTISQTNVSKKGDFGCPPRWASTCNSDEEIISEDEVEENNILSKFISTGAENSLKVSFPGLGITKKNEDCAWSEATREVEALVHLNENAGWSSSHASISKLSRSGKGGRGKAKSKSSFHFQPHKEDLYLAVNYKDETHSPSNKFRLLEESKCEHRTIERSMPELLEFFHGGKIEQSESHVVQTEVAVEQDYTKHSMAELLDCFQEKNGLLQDNSKVCNRTSGGRAQLIVKRGITSLGDRKVDDDDPLEALDSDPSSDDEDCHPNLKLIIHESKRKTMADQLQEVCGASSVRGEGIPSAFPKQSGIGLFGKLQRIMQSEKEKEMDFVKSLQEEVNLNDEGGCIDVRILSRSLEAKLTVCSCSFIRNEESSLWMDNQMGGRNSTIIFSSRSCTNIDLEVGNFIRIHPPWKEVHINGKDETVILSTNFSHISA